MTPSQSSASELHDELSVSPYLLRPLRSYVDALRDRMRDGGSGVSRRVEGDTSCVRLPCEPLRHENG